MSWGDMGSLENRLQHTLLSMRARGGGYRHKNVLGFGRKKCYKKIDLGKDMKISYQKTKGKIHFDLTTEKSHNSEIKVKIL